MKKLLEELEDLGFPSIAESLEENEFEKHLLLKDIEKAKSLDDYDDLTPYDRAMEIVENW